MAGTGRTAGPDPAGREPPLPGGPRLPVVLVVVGVLATVGAGWLVSFRAGGAALALTLAVAAAMRLLLPVQRVGTLAVRSRAVDVTTLALMAVAVAVLAQNAPG